ncbi:hypothetical protein AB6G58_08015 [Providencia huaxiensis]
MNWVKTIKHTYDLKTMTNTLREALTTDEKGQKFSLHKANVC